MSEVERDTIERLQAQCQYWEGKIRREREAFERLVGQQRDRIFELERQLIEMIHDSSAG